MSSSIRCIIVGPSRIKYRSSPAGAPMRSILTILHPFGVVAVARCLFLAVVSTMPSLSTCFRCLFIPRPHSFVGVRGPHSCEFVLPPTSFPYAAASTLLAVAPSPRPAFVFSFPRMSSAPVSISISPCCAALVVPVVRSSCCVLSFCLMNIGTL